MSFVFGAGVGQKREGECAEGLEGVKKLEGKKETGVQYYKQKEPTRCSRLIITFTCRMFVKRAGPVHRHDHPRTLKYDKCANIKKIILNTEQKDL